MLEEMCRKGKENLFGVDDAIGLGVVTVAALSIIPITREIIYQVYKLRGKLSDNLQLQATFLEMNKTRLENNNSLTTDKKSKIIQKQQNLAKKLMILSDKLKVKSAKSIVDSKKELQNDNRGLDMDDMRDEVSNSPLELI